MKNKTQLAQEYASKNAPHQTQAYYQGFLSGWDACEQYPLNPGVYDLPPNCWARVREGKIIITLKKRTRVPCNRCRDCKHIDFGYATAGGWDKTTVCKAHPKQVKYYRTSRIREEGIFYATLATNRACDKFEPRNE